MSQCPSCSTDAPQAARFCGSCGAALDATPLTNPTKTMAARLYAFSGVVVRPARAQIIPAAPPAPPLQPTP